eukprot:5172375-Pleurochrysis_carterae.AAC.1
MWRRCTSGRSWTSSCRRAPPWVRQAASSLKPSPQAGHSQLGGEVHHTVQGSVRTRGKDGGGDAGRAQRARQGGRAQRARAAGVGGRGGADA